MPVLIGLLAALLIGVSDFLGARAAGHTTALQTTTAAFFGGTLAALLYSPLLGSPNPTDLAYGAASGVALAIALTTLWRAYSMSNIGVAGPVASVVSTTVPVLWDSVRGEVPGGFGWAGIVIGVGALFLSAFKPASAAPVPASDSLAVKLGLTSGLFFAVMYLTAAASTSEEAGTWPVVTQRSTALLLAVGAAVITRRSLMAGGSATRWSVLSGVFGASGVAAVVYAGQRYPIAPVVVSSSMYPAVAITMAWMFMHQQLTRRQVIGLVGALAGIALMALD